MVTMRLEAVGSKQVSRTLKRYEGALMDLTEPLQDVADAFAKMELRQFATQGRGSKEPWAQLSPGYRRSKARTHPGRPILVRTGDLRRDMTQRPFGVEQITSDSLRLGTALPYARYHQQGTARMPRRKVVNLTESQRQRLMKIVQAYIVGAKPSTPRSM